MADIDELKEKIEKLSSALGELQAFVGKFDDDAEITEKEEPVFDCVINHETGCAQSHRSIKKMEGHCESLGFIPVPRRAHASTLLNLLFETITHAVCFPVGLGTRTKDMLTLEEGLEQFKQAVLKMHNEKYGKLNWFGQPRVNTIDYAD